MTDEFEVIYSPLQQSYTEDGITVDIQIYRSPTSGWTLEVVDQYGNSTVWEAEFETDQEALDQVLWKSRKTASKRSLVRSRM
jgi:hypothetical protein